MVPMKQSEYNTLLDKQWGYTILHGLKCIYWETVLLVNIES